MPNRKEEMDRIEWSFLEEGIDGGFRGRGRIDTNYIPYGVKVNSIGYR